MRNVTREGVAYALAAAQRSGLLDAADTLSVFIDLSVIEDRLQRLRDAFPASTLHAIPIKTNPLGFALRHVVASGFGLEAASMGEMLLARAAKVPNAKLVFDSPAKTRAEVDLVLSDFRGARVNADSLAELERFPRSGSGVNLGLRINPLVKSESVSSMEVGGESSKFGIPITEHAAILLAATSWDDIDGLHMHIGSQVPSIDRMVEAIKKVVELAESINRHAGSRKIKVIDIGGGFPVNYVGREPFMLEHYADAIRGSCSSLFDGSYQLVTEFGRYVYANSGWAAAVVEYVKERNKRFTLVSHAGADMFLRECYNPSEWHHEISILSPDGLQKTEGPVMTDIAGPLCFGGDYIARNRELPEAAPGDILAIHDIGANTFALWSKHCSRQFPKVIAYRGDRDPMELQIVKKRETYEQLVQFWA